MRFVYFLVSSSLLIGLVLLIRTVFRKKLAPGVIYALWLIPLLRLMVPFAGWELPVFGTAANILNAPYMAVTEWLVEEETARETFVDPGFKEESTAVERTKVYEAVKQEKNELGEVFEDSVTPMPEVEASPQKTSYLWILSGIWVIGSLLLGVYAVIQNRKLVKSVNAMKMIGEREGIAVCVSEKVKTPCLIGVKKPKIIVTEEVLKDTDLYEYILQHELAHFYQKDHIWKVVKILICIIYWWNPLVWFAATCSEEDAELACDERVLKGQTNEARKAYGYALLKLLANAQSKNQHFYAATSMSGSKKSLKHRIQQISHKTSTKKEVLLPVMLLLISVLFLGCGIPSAKNWMKTGEWEYGETEDTTFSESKYEYFLQDNIQSQLIYYEIYEYGELAERRILACGEMQEFSGEAKFCYESSKYSDESWLTVEFGGIGIEMPTPLSMYKGSGYYARSALQCDGKKLELTPEESIILTADYKAKGEEEIQTYNCRLLSAYTEEELKETLKDNYVVSLVRSVVSELPSGELYEMYLQREYPESDKTVEEDVSEAKQLTLAWADAFVDRNTENILLLATETAKQQMLDNAILDESLKSFGWSSPWPMFGETLYQIVSCDSSGAEILYYAADSTPHLTVWQEKLGFEEIAGKLMVSSWQIHWCDAIYSMEDYKVAYPKNKISDTPMDYYNNGLGEALNQNALLNSSMAYQPLFDAGTAALELLNISKDEELVHYSVEDNGETATVEIYFLEEGGKTDMVEVTMWQPYGEEGIWIPK